MNVQQFAEAVQVATHDGVSNVDADIFDFAKTIDDHAVLLLGVTVLFFEDVHRIPGGAGIKQKHIALECFQQFYTQAQPARLDASIFVDMQCG